MTRAELNWSARLEILRWLCVAWVIKLGGRLSRVRLSAVEGAAEGDGGRWLEAVSFTDWVVAWGTWCTARKCFFRAFILAMFLRRRGVPVVLNVGLHRPDPGRSRRRMDGHCWLTLAGEPVFEPGNDSMTGSVHLGTGLNGVQFWMGGAEPVTAVSLTQGRCREGDEPKEVFHHV